MGIEFKPNASILGKYQVMRVTRMHYLDEVNTNDEVIPSDEKISHH